ncbi:MAG TPA: hypothetical protein VE990_04820 [Acidimicrobiales bacterium]|nr:hypothetical protein [Acidimicrobiales bacterium]
MEALEARAPRLLAITSCLIVVGAILVIAVRLPFSTDVGSLGPGSLPGVGGALVTTTTTVPATTTTSFNLGVVPTTGRTAAATTTTTAPRTQPKPTSSSTTTSTTTTLLPQLPLPSPIRLPGLPLPSNGTGTSLPGGGLLSPTTTLP